MFRNLGTRRTYLRHPVAYPHLLFSLLGPGGVAAGPLLLSRRALPESALGILGSGRCSGAAAVRFGPGARTGPLSRRAPVPDPDRPDHPVHLRWHGADPTRGADAEGGGPDRDRGADRVGRGRPLLLAARRAAEGATRADRRLSASAQHPPGARDLQSCARLPA